MPGIFKRLLKAIEQENLPKVQSLITKGLSKIHLDQGLCLCAKRGWSDGVKEFLSHGADVSGDTVNKHTPLMMAAMFRDDPATISLLIEAGCDVNKQQITPPCETALTIACKYQRNLTVAMLLNVGANPNIANVNGDTPLAIAILGQNIAMVRSLIRHNANVNMPIHALQSIDVSLPIHISLVLKRNTAISSLLYIAGAKLDINRLHILKNTNELARGIVNNFLSSIMPFQVPTLKHISRLKYRNHIAYQRNFTIRINESQNIPTSLKSYLFFDDILMNNV